MSKQNKRRNFDSNFKAKVALEAITYSGESEPPIPVQSEPFCCTLLYKRKPKKL
jgi:hypothetical protein